MFRMYDINSDGAVDENDIIAMLKKVFFIKELNKIQGEFGFETYLANEAFVEEMAKSIIRLFDTNGNRVLEFSEFKEVILGKGTLIFRWLWKEIWKLE